MTEYIEKLIALQSAMIARKAEIDSYGLVGEERDRLEKAIDALESVKLFYGTDTRRLDKHKNKHEIERDKRIAENLGKNPF